jgi:hypothetical protein
VGRSWHSCQAQHTWRKRTAVKLVNIYFIHSHAWPGLPRKNALVICACPTGVSWPNPYTADHGKQTQNWRHRLANLKTWWQMKATRRFKCSENFTKRRQWRTKSWRWVRRSRRATGSTETSINTRLHSVIPHMTVITDKTNYPPFIHILAFIHEWWWSVSGMVTTQYLIDHSAYLTPVYPPPRPLFPCSVQNSARCQKSGTAIQ